MFKNILLISLICFLSITPLAFAAGNDSGKEVVAEITQCVIPADYIVPTNTGTAVKSFEDQTVVITETKELNMPDGSKGMYHLFDLNGLVHDCPDHGREVIQNCTGGCKGAIKVEDAKDCK